MALSPDFVEGAFFAICQRPPTNREMANIMGAGTKRKAIFCIKTLPEANPFFNHFYDLSFNWIDSLLLVGAAPSAFQADILVEDGVNCFFNVSGRDLPYSKHLPEAIYCRRFDIQNDCYNGPAPFEDAVRAVLGALADRRRVYVHCYSGTSRSAAVAGLAVGCLRGKSYSEAVEYIKERRPVAYPHPDLLTLAEANGLIRKLRHEKDEKKKEADKERGP